MNQVVDASPARPEQRWPGRLWLALLILAFGHILLPTSSRAAATNYFVRGVVTEIRKDDHQLVIAHEAVPDFMDAMTMPFNVRDPSILTNVAAGQQIEFQLHVNETESWIDEVKPAGVRGSAANVPAPTRTNSISQMTTNSAARKKNPLRDFKFTNELGEPVSLSDFNGQALALTFFFTRCPVPDFCPRLSRNFEAVQRQLKQMTHAPTNWHLLSITFDPAHDTPEILKTYGASYQYDPAHWSFLTGPSDKIAELARLCDVKYDPDNGLFNHNFRTLIIDASNRLQMVFPTSGDLSDQIVVELLKAAAATNPVPGTGK